MLQLKTGSKKRDLILSSVSICILLVLLALAQEGVILDNYGLRVINLCFIYSMLGLSLNLIHGETNDNGSQRRQQPSYQQRNDIGHLYICQEWQDGFHIIQGLFCLG